MLNTNIVKAATTKRRKRKAKKRTGKRRKGGWKPTRLLTTKEAREAVNFADDQRMNLALDFRPPDHIGDGDDSKRKRWIVQKLNRLFEALNRRLRRHDPSHAGTIAFTVFEKRAASDGKEAVALHAHCMLKVSRADRDVIERHCDGKILRAEWIEGPGSYKRRLEKARYVTKQRQPVQPEYEALYRWYYDSKTSLPVPGKRISYTKAAMAELELYRQKIADRKAARMASKAARDAPPPPSTPVQLHRGNGPNARPHPAIVGMDVGTGTN
jgi:hypothetical protein